MAELILYNNTEYQNLPFIDLLPHLSWLPYELETYTSSDTLWIIFNILLVFSGARTAALLQELVTTHLPLIQRLNDSLLLANATEFALQVEHTYYGDWLVRRNNPRFIRKYRLTTHEIGMNLDMVSPGNIEHAGSEERLYIDITEIRTWTQATGEVVIKRCLPTDGRLAQFMDRKVEVFNRMFGELGLDDKYRFEWFSTFSVKTPKEIFSRDVPSQEWWDSNWIFVAKKCVGPRSHLRNIFEQYRSQWPAIVEICQFHNQNMYYMHLDPDFGRRVAAVYDEVDRYVKRNLSVDMDDLHLKLSKLDSERQSTNISFPKSSYRRAAWGRLIAMISAEVTYWIKTPIAESPGRGVTPYQGLHCPVTEGRYWLAFITGVGWSLRYIILG
jgi:hypothetical protein